MREEQQRKTTAAAEALFSPARLALRRALLPAIVSETNFILGVQRYRTPLLDQVFQAVSFVGSHVFYMLWLPMLFWCGQAQYGRHLTMLLALALWACNFIKDGLCLPRPTSPPVVKLSSQLYAIEYGFPSAHAMNSVLMAGFSAVYCVYHAYADAPLAPLAAAGVWAAAATFIVAISFSRLYCGMHTATDLVGGLLLGGLLLAVWLSNYATIEAWLTSSPYVFPMACAAAAALSWVYPDPVDSTPSYDDTVSFVWVMAGVASGTRAFVGHPLSVAVPALANVRYAFATVGLPMTLARLGVGVAIVVVWRLAMKRVLLTILPPVYRALGLKPRKFFLSAQEYQTVDRPLHPTPSVLHLDTLRADPAAAATATTTTPTPTPAPADEPAAGVTTAVAPVPTAAAATHRRVPSDGLLLEARRKAPSEAPAGPARTETPGTASARTEDALRHAFHRLPRYDVEVVTRCIVYFGIGYLAVFGIPLAFDAVGLAPPLAL